MRSLSSEAICGELWKLSERISVWVLEIAAAQATWPRSVLCWTENELVAVVSFLAAPMTNMILLPPTRLMTRGWFLSIPPTWL